MPPSPALRFSQARQLRTHNHRRGRSLEGGLQLKERDDDLALFNNMQARKRENLLLQSMGDLDESLSKLRYFSDFNLGISIPVRRGSSDLLNAEGGKSECDWLLTPPDTPLFTSLDDDTPPVNLVRRSRPRSQASPIPRTANTRKNYWTGRSSASPFSPPPRSGGSTFQSRGRPSSAPCSSRSPVLRPTTPSRRPSTPSNKRLSPVPRCSSPTVQRKNTGSSVQPFRGRSIPPRKPRCGSSASPKLRAWQLNLSSFSSDPPPNLRTSLSGSPPSHIRSLSPASRNGYDSFSKCRRQSTSPTASKSANSSHSNGRQGHSHFQNKGSAASPGDDDVHLLHSAIVGISDHPTSRKNGAFPSRKAVKFLKKPSRTMSANSALKRSFDSSVRKMDNLKSPKNMFRPLLSSVQTTPLNVKGNTAHSTMVSRNSSVIASSDSTSEQVARVAPDDKVSDHEQDDMVKEWGKAPYPDTQEEIIIFDMVDEINEDVHGIHDREPNDVHKSYNQTSANEIQLRESENIICRNGAAAVDVTASESSRVSDDPSDVDCNEIMESCSNNCAESSLGMEAMDGNATIYQDCTKTDGLLTTRTSEATVFVTNSNAIHTKMALGENNVCELEPMISTLKLSEETSCRAVFGKQERNNEQDHDCLQDTCIAQLVVEEGEKLYLDHHFVGNQAIHSSRSETDAVDQRLQQFDFHLSSKGGISILLKRSSSSKWPDVQGRAFTARKMSCDYPFYPRGSLSFKKSCIGQGSASTSSSDDSDLAKQMEVQLQYQSRSRKAEMESSRDDSDASTVTRIPFSGNPSTSSEALAYVKSTSEKDLDDSVRNLKHVALEDASVVMGTKGSDLVNPDKHSFFMSSSVLEDYKHDGTDRVKNASPSDGSELSGNTQCVRLDDASAATFPNDDDLVFSGNAEVLLNNNMSISDLEIQVMTPESSITEDDLMLYSHLCEVDVSDPPMCASSVVIVGGIEDGCENIATSQFDGAAFPNSKDAVDVFQGPTVSPTSENDTLVSTLEIDVSDCAHGINGELAVTVEHPGGQKLRMRSLTSDAATDSIMFCSSIVYDLAYQAAIIAMEKEDLISLKRSQPTVTILGQPDFISKNPLGRTSSRHTSKFQEARQRQSEREDPFPSNNTENDVKVQEPLTYIAVNPDKVDSMKSPKQEFMCNCSVM